MTAHAKIVLDFLAANILLFFIALIGNHALTFHKMYRSLNADFEIELQKSNFITIKAGFHFGGNIAGTSRRQLSATLLIAQKSTI